MRLDFLVNPPQLPPPSMMPRRNPGVVQQWALPIPLPTQPTSSAAQPMASAVLGQQVHQPQMLPPVQQAVPAFAGHQLQQAQMPQVQQGVNFPQQMVAGIGGQQVQPPQMAIPNQPANAAQQVLAAFGAQQPAMGLPQQPQGAQANPVGGQVYTMGDLHNLAVTQCRHLQFRRRQGGFQ